MAGISAWIRQNKKKIKIIGVEVNDSACLTEALIQNKNFLSRLFTLLEIKNSRLVKDKSLSKKSWIICRRSCCFPSRKK